MAGGGGNQERNGTGVLIPDTGAAAYWYVDPRARGVPTPGGYDPYGQRSGLSSGIDGKRIEFIDAVNRLLSPTTPLLQQQPQVGLPAPSTPNDLQQGF